MIIGVDTRRPTKNKTGMAYLSDNILPMLVDMDKNNQYKAFGLNFGVKASNFKCFTLPKILQRILNFIWRKFFYPSVNLFIGKTDVFFFPNFVDFPVKAKKKILLVPDLTFMKFPQFVEAKNRKFLNKNVPLSIQRSDKIITISQDAKKEIINYFKVPEEKIEVIYLGHIKDIQKIENQNEIENVKNKYGILGSYILFVGTLEPRKNIEGIIKAYNLLNDEIKEKYKLVIAGGKGWYYDTIFTLVDELNLNKNIVFTGYLPACDVSYIYSGASAFIFPSFYEGFGIPILDAFCCGIPVVTAHNSSLSEIGGDAVVYCDAGNIDTIKEGIEKVLLDKDLRNKLIIGGYERLKLFDWNESAKKILEIINLN